MSSQHSTPAALFGRVRAAAVAGALAGTLAASPALSQELSGELVMINWLGGAQGEMMQALEQDFMAKNPGVTIRDIVPTSSGDNRGGIRAVILGGEQADLLINTWPAFRAELIDAGLILSVDEMWDQHDMGAQLNDSWQALSTVDGTNYGVTYTFGNRSGIWYRHDTLAKAGLDAPPADWDQLLTSFDKLNAAGVTPISVPAKVWAHAEWFESLLIRVAGVETAAKLAAHEIPWTDDSVKDALRRWQQLIEANCCDGPNTMLGRAWADSVDAALKTGDAGYVLMGMWLNTRAKQEYGETPGDDYQLFQFPALGAGHDDVSMVDAKEFNVLSTVKNPEAAAAFMAYMLTADAAAIMADYGLASPSAAADTSLYDPVIARSVEDVSKATAVQFVLGDLLPGDLVHEYRVQLQKFLQDPSDENIDTVTAAIEKVALDSY